MFDNNAPALNLQHTPEPWRDGGSWIYAPAVQCRSANCIGGCDCYFNYYGGEVICESVGNPADRSLILASPKMYRAMIYAQQVILEALITGRLPDDGMVGCALLMIEDAAGIAQGIKSPLLLMAPKEEVAA